MTVSHTQTIEFFSLLVQSLAAGISLRALQPYIHQVGTVLQSVNPRINNQPMREDLTWLLGEWYTETRQSEGFDSCDRPSNLTQIGFKSSIFQPCDLEI